MSFIIYLALSLSISFNHDYHFGLTEVNYNKENKSLETSIKLFTDDLNKALTEENKVNINLNTEEEILNSDIFIQEYISKNLSISVNNKDVSYNYLGKEYDGDVVWLFIEATKVKKIKEFKLMNSLLFDTYDDQKHLLNINLDGKIKSQTLEQGFSTFSLSL